MLTGFIFVEREVVTNEGGAVGSTTLALCPVTLRFRIYDRQATISLQTQTKVEIVQFLEAEGHRDPSDTVASQPP